MGAITSGESTFCYRDDEYRVEAGDLVLINPQWVHACNPIANRTWGYLMLYVDSDWLTDLRYSAGLLETPDWQDISTPTVSDNGWYGRFDLLAECLLDPQSELLQKQSAVVEFLSDLMHELAKQPAKSQLQAPEMLQELAAYLDLHAADDVSLEQLCDYSGYSAGHLIRAFKKYFGLTPHAYLTNRRIQLGRRELAKGASIVEAALNAGFADQPHFQRVFKRLMAATPNQYRAPSIQQQVHATDRKQ